MHDLLVRIDFVYPLSFLFRCLVTILSIMMIMRAVIQKSPSIPDTLGSEGLP